MASKTRHHGCESQPTDESGIGTALEFAMEIIIKLSGKEHGWMVAEPLITIPTLHYHELGDE